MYDLCALSENIKCFTQFLGEKPISISPGEYFQREIESYLLDSSMSSIITRLLAKNQENQIPVFLAIFLVLIGAIPKFRARTGFFVLKMR